MQINLSMIGKACTAKTSKNNHKTTH